jgi:hypothetical protein
MVWIHTRRVLPAVLLLTAGAAGTLAVTAPPAPAPDPAAVASAAAAPGTALPPGWSSPGALHAAEIAATPQKLPSSALLTAAGRLRIVPHLYPKPPPATLDLRWDAPAVADQGPASSCTAWAVDYSVLGWWAQRQGVTEAPFAPMYVYSQIELPGGASRTVDALQVTATQGVPPQSVYWQNPQDSADKPGPAERAAGRAYRIRGYTEVFTAPGQGSATRQAIEAAMVADGPVTLDIPIDAAFRDLDASHYTYSGLTGRVTGLHDLAVFAYDPTGVWVENTWGTGWGIGGWAHLSWAFVTGQALNSFAVLGGFVHHPPAAPAATDLEDVPADLVTSAGMLS